MAVAVAVIVAESVTVEIVLVIPIHALTPHPKGLDAPLMSPMTSRTGTKGRSETTFVAGAGTGAGGRDRGDRACNDGFKPPGVCL